MTDLTFTTEIPVELIEVSASDQRVVQAARVSTLGAASEPAEADGLIRYLMKSRHGTPFEHNSFTFRVTAPIFVWREHHRHRVFSYNEESGRYKQLDPVFYVPNHDRPVVQEGKPGHYNYVPGTHEQRYRIVRGLTTTAQKAYAEYEFLLKEGVAREVARMCLPVNIMSTGYVTCNARALMGFLSLRTKRDNSTYPSYPQYEIEMVAEQYERIFAEHMPVTYRAFDDFGRVAP